MRSADFGQRRDSYDDRRTVPQRRNILHDPIPAHPCVYRMGRLEKLIRIRTPTYENKT